MGFATSDGQYHEDELSLLKDSFQQYASGNASVEPTNDRTDVNSDPGRVGSLPNQEETKTRSFWNKLTGDDGGERYKTWPEEAVRGIADNMRTFLTTEPGSEANIQASTRMAFDLGLGGIATAGMRPGAGLFGGRLGAARASDMPERSITARTMRLDNALEELGKRPPEEVYQNTGWWKDVRDGKWKFEISDANAHINEDVLTKMYTMATDNLVAGTGASYVKVNLNKILKHDELYKGYPELKNVPFYYEPKYTKSIAAAGLSPLTGELVVVAGPKFKEMSATEQRGTILHEVQHLIQEMEGFAKGGYIKDTPARTLKEMATQIANEYKDLTAKGFSNLSQDEKKKLEGLRKFAMETERQADNSAMEAYGNYRRLGGEIESNNVDARDALRKLGISEEQIGHPSKTEVLDPTNLRRILDNQTK